jgi:hypothetical protein
MAQHRPVNGHGGRIVQQSLDKLRFRRPSRKNRLRLWLYDVRQIIGRNLGMIRLAASGCPQRCAPSQQARYHDDCGNRHAPGRGHRTPPSRMFNHFESGGG